MVKTTLKDIALYLKSINSASNHCRDLIIKLKNTTGVKEQKKIIDAIDDSLYNIAVISGSYTEIKPAKTTRKTVRRA